MRKKILKIQKLVVIFLVGFLFFSNVSAQYKTYQLTDNGDTLNAIDKKDQKQGKWVIRTDELRGEPGYEDEGVFKDGKKEGKWRRYNLNGDLIATEYYKFGGKDGKQQYFTPMGDIIREESWHSYNPDAPYDTIAIYGNTENNSATSYKIVKVEQYSVRDGEWKYYEPATGRIIRTELYDRGSLHKDPVADVATDAPKKKVKPQEVLDFEKKNSGKKKVKLREGQTGY